MEVLGERWTMVVLREVFNGVRRFDDMRRHSGVPRQVLTDRLALLVDAGILRREPYREPGQRERHEYRPTDKGFDLYPVLVAVRRVGRPLPRRPGGLARRVRARRVRGRGRRGAALRATATRSTGRRDVATRPGPGIKPFGG